MKRGIRRMRVEKGSEEERRGRTEELMVGKGSKGEGKKEREREIESK